MFNTEGSRYIGKNVFKIEYFLIKFIESHKLLIKVKIIPKKLKTTPNNLFKFIHYENNRYRINVISPPPLLSFSLIFLIEIKKNLTHFIHDG